LTVLFTEEAIYKKSPQELTALLYEACMDNLEAAIESIKAKENIIANEKLKKANDILYRLGAGINYEAGIISDQLEAIYNYMADQLVEANIHKDIKVIEGVLDILTTIAGAWNQAMIKKTDAQPRDLRKKSLAYEQQDTFYDNPTVDEVKGRY
jgi:flagellar secretion chaperone FliS